MKLEKLFIKCLARHWMQKAYDDPLLELRLWNQWGAMAQKIVRSWDKSPESPNREDIMANLRAYEDFMDNTQQ